MEVGVGNLTALRLPLSLEDAGELAVLLGLADSVLDALFHALRRLIRVKAFNQRR